MKSVVVTGASTGIGWGCAKVLIGKGFRVFGSVRKPADADRLSREFGPNFVPLLFDVTDQTAVAAGAEAAAKQPESPAKQAENPKAEPVVAKVATTEAPIAPIAPLTKPRTPVVVQSKKPELVGAV